ncbi:MAG: HNH endonuclease [bacterium]|nr:HNH endonuclease [bacterium]
MQADNAPLASMITEAQNLGLFRKFCDKNSTKDAQLRMRTIYRRSGNPIETTRTIFAREFDADLSDSDASRMFTLITSFLNKSDYRKPIGSSTRNALLQKQSHRCAICGRDIDAHAHADHVVPFKFVGDELDDNLQMLCTACNSKKNKSLDYQVRFFLRLI